MSDTPSARSSVVPNEAGTLPKHSRRTHPIRTPKDIIDQAIYDNRISEYILHNFAIIFVVVGVIVISFGMYTQQPMVSVIGAAASSLFLPAMKAARRTRKESIALRLLEAPLQRADTAKEAADTIRGLVTSILTDKS